MNYLPFIQILVPILTFLTAIFGFLWHRQTEKIKIIENQISQNKYKAYGELVSIFYDILKDVKQNKTTNNNELVSKIINSKKDLFIYGSDTVFKKFNTWLIYSSAHPNDPKQLKYFLELMLEIRKDIGQKNTILTNKDILISLTQNEQDYEKLIAAL